MTNVPDINFARTGYRRPEGLRFMISAREAYPQLERAVLSARTEIWASFRVFDLSTRLRSAEAREVGEDWFDLIVHTLKRGVAVNLAITDFDPVARPRLHRRTWHSLRMLWSAAELAGPGAPLNAIAALHPARVGPLARLALWPVSHAHLKRTAQHLDGMEEGERSLFLRDSPGLAPLLVEPSGGSCRPALRPPPLAPATHHQKLMVVDRGTVYLGGLDLDERRYDSMPHDRPGRETWHDVQLIASGPGAEEAQIHLESFLDVSAGRMPSPGPHRHLLRTLSRKRTFPLPFLGPRPVIDELDRAHQTFALRAERLIYLETQFFRDRALARTFAKAARRKKGLGLILILPAAPEELAFEDRRGPDQRFGEYLQSACLDILDRAFGERMFVGTLAQPRDRDDLAAEEKTRIGAPMVYVHSKVSIFDDETAIVSSANLNGRSLRWDTEAGLLIDDPVKARELRMRLMQNWLPEDAPADCLTPDGAVAGWRALARDNASRPAQERRGFLLPYNRAAARRFGRAMSFLPDELA